MNAGNRHTLRFLYIGRSPDTPRSPELNADGSPYMNLTLAESNWMPFKGAVCARWSKLTGEHLDAIAGKRPQLLDKLQEMYGINKTVADKEIKDVEQHNKAYRGKITAERICGLV